LRLEIRQVVPEKCPWAELRESTDIDQLALTSKLVERREKAKRVMGKSIDSFIGPTTKRENDFLLFQRCQAVGYVGPAWHGLAASRYFVQIDPCAEFGRNEVDASGKCRLPSLIMSSAAAQLPPPRHGRFSCV
jgi:hypothetical protein